MAPTYQGWWPCLLLTFTPLPCPPPCKRTMRGKRKPVNRLRQPPVVRFQVPEMSCRLLCNLQG